MVQINTKYVLNKLIWAQFYFADLVLLASEMWIYFPFYVQKFLHAVIRPTTKEAAAVSLLFCFLFPNLHNILINMYNVNLY